MHSPPKVSPKPQAELFRVAREFGRDITCSLLADEPEFSTVIRLAVRGEYVCEGLDEFTPLIVLARKHPRTADEPGYEVSVYVMVASPLLALTAYRARTKDSAPTDMIYELARSGQLPIVFRERFSVCADTGYIETLPAPYLKRGAVK